MISENQKNRIRVLLLHFLMYNNIFESKRLKRTVRKDYDMEKIILFNVPGVDIVKRIAGNLKIKVITYDISESECTLLEFANKTADVSRSGGLSDGSRSTSSLILMCNLTDKHVDKMLAKLRENNVTVDYKAVLTKTNENWSLNKMMIHMELEKNRSYK